MVVKISSKFQVVIPEEARKALALRPGTQVDVVVKGGIAYLVPVRSLAELRKEISQKPVKADSRSLRDKKDRRL